MMLDNVAEKGVVTRQVIDFWKVQLKCEICITLTEGRILVGRLVNNLFNDGPSNSKGYLQKYEDTFTDLHNFPRRKCSLMCKRQVDTR